MALQPHLTRLDPRLGEETQANAGFRGWAMPVLCSQPSSLETRQSLHQEGAGSVVCLLRPRRTAHTGLRLCPFSALRPPLLGTGEQPSPHPCNKQRGMHLISPVQCDYRRKNRLTVGPRTETGAWTGSAWSMHLSK